MNVTENDLVETEGFLGFTILLELIYTRTQAEPTKTTQLHTTKRAHPKRLARCKFHQICIVSVGSNKDVKDINSTQTLLSRYGFLALRKNNVFKKALFWYVTCVRHKTKFLL